MKIFNTMSKAKEEFVPVDENEVKIYACGPTVYNYIHIGNARPLCVFDVLRRYLEYRGYNVKFVQNFTDIDDKIINRANEEGISFEEVSKKYIEEFWTDAHGLNFKDATIHPKATENIDEIIDIIKSLEDKGYAYAVNGDVYFRTLKFKEYGKLSHQPIDDLVSGARIAVGDIKENPLDFALWKGAKEGEPYWDSPWGKGRPGWHIECSAMNRKYLGKTIDIHCGGQDLIFPLFVKLQMLMVMRLSDIFLSQHITAHLSIITLKLLNNANHLLKGFIPAVRALILLLKTQAMKLRRKMQK